jgi:hypothetical protein
VATLSDTHVFKNHLNTKYHCNNYNFGHCTSHHWKAAAGSKLLGDIASADAKLQAAVKAHQSFVAEFMRRRLHLAKTLLPWTFFLILRI